MQHTSVVATERQTSHWQFLQSVQQSWY